MVDLASRHLGMLCVALIDRLMANGSQLPVNMYSNNI